MIQPLYDKVVIEVKEAEKTTASGIVLPDSANEKSNVGVVVAVGKGRLLENGTLVPLTVETGQTILFSKFAGTEAKYSGKDYLILSEKDILAIVE